jgi:hypothetical protein
LGYFRLLYTFNQSSGHTGDVAKNLVKLAADKSIDI